VDIAMTRQPPSRLLCLLALSLTLAACDKKAVPEPKPPLHQVSVETLQAQPIEIISELSGRLSAPRIAEVRARVAGVVLKQVFVEGSDVKQGDVLFQIDPATFKADVNSARASLRKAQANQFQTRLQADRYHTLIDINAVSRQEYDNARAAAQTAEADVEGAQAALDRAQLNLGYATVTAPISGRIGRALVTEGALVGQNETTALAIIQQLNPIHADLTQSTRELGNLRRAVRAGQLQQAGLGQVSATLIQDDGSLYPMPGKLLFSDISVDPGTGQIIVRSEFPNPDLDLLPGSFVRVRVLQALNKEGLSVPQRAVTRDSAGTPKVLLVDAEQRINERVIQVAGVQDERWIVTDGLKPGDRVVIEGHQQARPGDQVKITRDENTPVATLSFVQPNGQ